MNTQTQEALKMAIEALETCITYNPYEQGFNTELVETALESGKEVLKNLEKDPSISRKAQPAQEPVAWTNMVFPELPNGYQHEKLGNLYDRFQMHQYAIKCLELASHPAPQPAQEPVAYELWKYGRPFQLVKRADVVDEMAYKARLDGAENVEVKALYTHPAPSCQECENLKHDLEGYMDANKALINREWQGLTSEEIRNLDLDNDVISVIFQTEKLLKEKNT